jgi:hypothetical protein
MVAAKRGSPAPPKIIVARIALLRRFGDVASRRQAEIAEATVRGPLLLLQLPLIALLSRELPVAELHQGM